MENLIEIFLKESEKEEMDTVCQAITNNGYKCEYKAKSVLNGKALCGVHNRVKKEDRENREKGIDSQYFSSDEDVEENLTAILSRLQ